MTRNSEGQYEKILPSDIRAEIADKYYLENRTQTSLAAEYGISQATISRIVNDPEVMQFMLKATTSAKVKALIRVHQHLDEAVDTQIELMRGQYEDQYKYLKQNAARDLLDRGGVRAEKEEHAETRVVVDFGSAGGLTLGVPDHSMDNAVGSMDNEEGAE